MLGLRCYYTDTVLSWYFGFWWDNSCHFQIVIKMMRNGIGLRPLISYHWFQIRNRSTSVLPIPAYRPKIDESQEFVRNVNQNIRDKLRSQIDNNGNITELNGISSYYFDGHVSLKKIKIWKIDKKRLICGIFNKWNKCKKYQNQLLQSKI